MLKTYEITIKVSRPDSSAYTFHVRTVNFYAHWMAFDYAVEECKSLQSDGYIATIYTIIRKV